jgi:hypothetical protein
MPEIKALELCFCSFTLHETDCFSMQAALVYSNQLQVLSVSFGEVWQPPPTEQPKMPWQQGT